MEQPDHHLEQRPALEAMPLDYNYMTADATWYTYDISNLVRKWYGGENYGLALEATTATYIELYSSDNTFNNPPTTYVLHGKNVVHLTQGSNSLHFFYGADGSPAIVEYNGVNYGYARNLQGDIIAIIRGTGEIVVQYTYDAWGKPTSKTGSMADTLGTLNPFRYRGYVYDEETGLYYLRNRYYNPNRCRFINADNIAVRNLFAYCNNSPIHHTDHSGALVDQEDWSLFEIFPELRTASAPVTLSAENTYFRKNIKPLIMEFLKDASDYAYNAHLYKSAKYDSNGKLLKSGYVDCSHLMYEVSGKVGSYTAPFRYGRYNGEKGKLFDQNGELDVELVEGMEVYSKTKGHVGMLLLYDFGDGEEWAVFQSTSEKITKSKALYLNDANRGPNITSFYPIDGGLPNWYYYTAPRYIEE